MTQEDFSIKATNLSKVYGRTAAIQDLNFSIRKGEIVGFLGPNGAGKSTTLKILTGLLPASSGAAYVCGYPVARNATHIQQRIGYMPENNPLPEDMRVWEYLHFRARIKSVHWRQRRRKIDEALEVCELQRKARRRIIGTLSKGFRQRVGIAEAILANPEVTILDEPTIGLDPHQVIAIRKLLDNLRGQTTVILSSHILSEVEVCCDRVLILNQGRLVASGTPAELRAEFLPGSVYVLSVRGDEDQVLETLRNIEPEITLENEASPDTEGFTTYRLRSPSDRNQAEHFLAALIRNQNLTLRGVHCVESSLEDIFLAATKRSWSIKDHKSPEEIA